MNKYMANARVAARSAHALLALGDANGAINRAYYAMFDGARAALEHVDSDLPIAKTHATIIRRFGRHVVISGGIDGAIGRHLNATEEMRITADFGADPVDLSVARSVIGRMDGFMAAIELFLSGKSP